ncbi:MAG: hypothetical protein M0006_12840 [Magnetospirillum sp.]|nr:hypothetical protein [Magnetospirillum sp.]
MADWRELRGRLAGATGADAGIDAGIAQAFALPPGDYTASPDKCRALVASALPGWHLHVGYGASGVFPYAALTRSGQHVEAEAPTLPLAILRAAAVAAALGPAASPTPSAPPPA